MRSALLRGRDYAALGVHGAIAEVNLVVGRVAHRGRYGFGIPQADPLDLLAPHSPSV